MVRFLLKRLEKTYPKPHPFDPGGCLYVYCYCNIILPYFIL